MKFRYFCYLFLIFMFCCGNGKNKKTDVAEDIQPEETLMEEEVEEVADENDIEEGSEEIIEESDDEVVPVDQDGDGFLSDQDCDDTNPDIYPGISRECRSECNIGYELCQEDATWTTCNASADCACSNFGSEEWVSCGLCGTVRRYCTIDSVWEIDGDCTEQGSCVPGVRTTIPCGNCGRIEAGCNDSCEWITEGECTGTGECTPGTIRVENAECPSGEIKGWVCSDDCAWVLDHECSTDCVGEARTGDFKDEVCVTGGAFVYGSNDDVGEYNEHPQRVIILSPFFIDKYPVTNARYKECVDAGVCRMPEYWLGGLITWNTPGYENYPVFGINLLEASHFCAWDNSRMIPREHMWEKAARGLYPVESLYPWGDEVPTCDGDLVCMQECDGGNHTCPVGQYPAGASIFGVEDLMGPGFEWTGDNEVSHERLPPCSIDPDTNFTRSFVRGTRSSFRAIRVELTAHPDVGFRCAKLMVPLLPEPYVECSIEVP